MRKRPLAYTAILIVLGEALGLMGIWQGMIFVTLFFILAGWKEKNKGILFFILISFVFYFQGQKAGDALLLEQERENTKVLVTGTVTKVVEGEQPYFYLKTEDLGENTLQLKVIKSPVLVENGDKVEVKGMLHCFSPPSNPGEFHANHYYHSIGVSFQCTSTQVTILEKNKNPFYSFTAFCFQTIKTFYHDSMKTENAAILSGIVLGDKGEIEKADKTGYQEAGISHILAISGLHMGLVGMGLFHFLRKRRISYMISATLSLAFLFFYTMIVGNSVSMERAFLMLAIVLIGEVMGRKSDLLTTLSLVAAIVVIKQPYVLLHSAFYLSFLAVYSFAVFPVEIEKIWKGNSFFKTYFLSGFCVQLGLFPILLESNHYLSTYSLWINFLVLFLFPYFLVVAFLISCFSFILPEVSAFLLRFIEYFIEGIRCLTKMNECVPFHKIRIPHNPWWWYVIYYLLVIASFYIMESSGNSVSCKRLLKGKKRFNNKRIFKEKSNSKGKNIYKEKSIFKEKKILKKKDGLKAKNLFREKKVYYVVFLWILFFCGMYGYHHQGKFYVTVLDVGQGDGILMKLEGGVNLLVDGGSSSKKQVGEYILLKAMDYYGMEQIDYAFLSHLDGDHINGVLELLELGKIKHVVISGYTAEHGLKESELMKYLTKENTIIVTKGDTFFLRGLEIKIHSPENGENYADENEASMVMEVSYHGKTLLFTGDMGEETEKNLLEEIPKNIDLLKVAHHGSKYSTNEEFLEKIKPANSVISSGTNRYGHPHAETLNRLMKVGTKIWRTDEAGAIEIKIEGDKMTISKKK